MDLLNELRTVAPSDVIGRVSRTLECMEIAEEEIALVLYQFPDCEALRGDGVFMALRPSGTVAESEMVYRAHAKEILGRIAHGDDLGPPTLPECFKTALDAILVVPPNETGKAFIFNAWVELFGDDHVEAYPGQADEIFGKLQNDPAFVNNGRRDRCSKSF